MAEYIEYGYDRKANSWCVIVFDENGYEINSSYVGHKESLKYELERMKAEYNVQRVIKVKAY